MTKTSKKNTETSPGLKTNTHLSFNTAKGFYHATHICFGQTVRSHSWPQWQHIEKTSTKRWSHLCAVRSWSGGALFQHGTKSQCLWCFLTPQIEVKKKVQL